MTETLTAYLDSRTVRAQVQASDWRAAVEQSGGLLADVGAVEPRYVEAMKATLLEYGPYAVIAPGIALPHARPEHGVNRPALSLVTLADPVEFGHSANDPVDVVIAFGAVDKETHLGALQQLAGSMNIAVVLQDEFGQGQNDRRIIRSLLVRTLHGFHGSRRLSSLCEEIRTQSPIHPRRRIGIVGEHIVFVQCLVELT
jgi:ascorbate PTS system EIIA or EIIAB component